MGHSDERENKKFILFIGLNPCSNGWGTLTEDIGLLEFEAKRLNPCSNGWGTLT